jgi:hypothetical protein
MIDTWLVTIRSPLDQPLSFVLLEIVALAWAAMTWRHARHDAGRRLTWVAVVVYGVLMEIVSYNATDAFEHGQFTVMFYDRQLPLYVVAIYPCLLYTGIALARALRQPPWREALAAGVAIVMLDVPFDLAGPPLGWWRWSDTDPNVAVRWFGVPVTSYYWHCAFGASLCALTGIAARRLRPRLWLALPIAPLTMMLGFVAFLPFHGLKAIGIGDGLIVAAALAVCSVAAWPRAAR